MDIKSGTNAKDLKIRVRYFTMLNLKILKESLGISSYDLLIQDMIKTVNNSKILNDISNNQLTEILSKHINKNLKSTDSILKRLSAYEMNYFTSIIDEIKMLSKQEKETFKLLEKINNNLSTKVERENEEENFFENYHYKELEKSHDFLSQKNEILNSKLNFLLNKVSKNDGVFSKGFTIKLDESDLDFLKEEK